LINRLNPVLNAKLTKAEVQDQSVVAVGVAPLLPKGVSLKLDKKGFIEVNERYATSVPGLYAAGDVIGPGTRFRPFTTLPHQN
jgi:dihydrolipoamide dehydrogenase